MSAPVNFSPAADDHFPELDSVVLKLILGGKPPEEASHANWAFRHFHNTVEMRAVTRSSTGKHRQNMRIHQLPLDVINYASNYVMLHVPVDAPELEGLKPFRKDVGELFTEQLQKRYGLAERHNYTVYHVAHPQSKLKELGKKLIMMDPTNEYTLVFSRAAYKRLAIGMLEKLASGNADKLWNSEARGQAASEYKDPNSPTYAHLKAIVENARLDADDVRTVIEAALKQNNYEFAAAMREIAAELFPKAGFKHRAAILAENREKGIGGQSPA